MENDPKADVILQEWLIFERRVLHADSPLIQRVEMRRAFYGGWRSALSTIMAIMEEGDEPTEADMAQMDAIERELTMFNIGVLAGTY